MCELDKLFLGNSNISFIVQTGKLMQMRKLYTVKLFNVFRPNQVKTISKNMNVDLTITVVTSG